MTYHHMQYLLDENDNPYPTDDMYAASKLLNDQERRRIGWNEYTAGNQAIQVSTVFLVYNHAIFDEEPDLYETMVFAPEPIIQKLMELSETDDRSIISKFFGGFDIMKRYHTKQEAQEGHKNMCIFIDVCLQKGLLDEVSA